MLHLLARYLPDVFPRQPRFGSASTPAPFERHSRRAHRRAAQDIDLGRFKWLIDGDTNRNAAVAVSYRKAGESAWKTGSTAAAGERVTQPNVFALVSPNISGASSISEPDTTYEARFILTNPDARRRPASERDRPSTVPGTRPEPREVYDVSSG